MVMRKIAAPSTQSLFIQMRVNGTLLSSGTAFIVETDAGPHLMTNRHNVTGRHQDTDEPLSKTGGIPTEILVTHNRKGRLGDWVQKVEPLYDDGTPRWREHPALAERADFVALPLTELDDVDLYPYDLAGPEIAVGPAETVSVIGFPFGMSAGLHFGVWATGFIASEPDVDVDNLPVLLIDCRSRQGQSGSPVIAYRASGMVSMAAGGSAMFSGPIVKLIGIYSGRVNSESDLGRVWKTSALSELVKSLGQGGGMRSSSTLTLTSIKTSL